MILAVSILIMGWKPKQPPQSADWDENTPLIEVLLALGEDKPLHYLDEISPEMITRGEELFTKGRTQKPDGKGVSTFISKYYMCTNCHNTVQEDPDLRKSDPELRLSYAVEQNLPFLQGTTMYGSANRESWYNDDYFKKYGDLVKAAQNSMEEAIQLCAQECAQGRKLEDWESKAIVAYIWSISYTLGDLQLREDTWKRLKQSQSSPKLAEAMITELKSYYSLKSPATFSYPPEDPNIGYGIAGDADNGKRVYDLSCKKCHAYNGVSRYLLDDSKLTFKKLYKNFDEVYDLIRIGTYAQPGARPYMPHYTMERMSNQQIEDLKSYVSYQAAL